jgi:hypothetical protein
MKMALLAIGLVIASPCAAQLINPGANPADVAQAQALAQAAQAAAATAAANACAPASSVPPIEQPVGTAGSAQTCRRSDAVQTRITRVTMTTSVAGGLVSGSWSTPLPAAPAVIFEAVNATAAQPIFCNLTATPTTTTFAGKCWIQNPPVVTLSGLTNAGTTGLTLPVTTTVPVGTQVFAFAIPTTQ